ncbi:MAG: hypothetical protein AAGA85_24555 [Bacteroidota bacterium]
MALDPLTILTSDWARQFVLDHERSDINKLLLNPPPEAQGHINLLVDQITSRRKAIKKLRTWYNHPGIIWPPPLSIEQSSSEEAATYKKQLITGQRLIDLTGGMGIDCMALSERFKETVYVECSEWLCTLMRHNAKVFDKDIRVQGTDAMEFLSDLDLSDLQDTTFYIDPARRNEHKKVVLLEDCEPDVTSIIPKLVAAGSQVLLKTSPLLDITAVTQTLRGLSKIHIVAVKNEVKEVLYLYSADAKDDPTLTAINLETTQPVITFQQEWEDHAVPQMASEAVSGSYLYEPNAALLKAGVFKWVSEKWELKKLDVHTHLYVCNELVPDFPGRTFKLLGLLDKKAMTKLSNQSVHVVSRNHPLSVNEIRKRYKLKEGGDEYVIAVRVGGKPVFLHARPSN